MTTTLCGCGDASSEQLDDDRDPRACDSLAGEVRPEPESDVVDAVHRHLTGDASVRPGAGVADERCFHSVMGDDVMLSEDRTRTASP
jgi:hypothetical protein